MPHDPALVQDTRAWLTRADRDLQAAEHNMKATPPLLDDAVFHCQQVIEKALKALLAWHDVPFRKTHNLTELGEACVKIDASLQEVAERAGPLTEYAWKFRYPGESEEPSVAETREALAVARGLRRDPRPPSRGGATVSHYHKLIGPVQKAGRRFVVGKPPQPKHLAPKE